MFNYGDRVAIKPHARTLDDGKIDPDLATVTNPHDPTDMTRLNGDKVGFYVRVKRDKTPHITDSGYHLSSLELV